MAKRLHEDEEDCPVCHAVNGEAHTIGDRGEPCTWSPEAARAERAAQAAKMLATLPADALQRELAQRTAATKGGR